MNDRKVVYLKDFISVHGRRVQSSVGVMKSRKYQADPISLSTQGIMLGLWMMATSHIVMAAYYQQVSLEFLVDSRQAFYRFPQFVD